MDHNSVFLVAADIGQSASVVISLVAFVPQWATLLRTKSASGISIRSWLLWLLSSALALLYAYAMYSAHGVGLLLLITSATLFLCNLLSVSLLITIRTQLRREYAPRYIDN